MMKMHKYTSLLTGLLLVAVFFVGCGNEPSTQNNEYLGELPSLEKQYVNKIDAKEKAIKKSTDMEESFKLSKELEQLKEERDKKIDEYASANPLTKPLPFEALEGIKDRCDQFQK
jgi:hypothetical protein